MLSSGESPCASSPARIIHLGQHIHGLRVPRCVCRARAAACRLHPHPVPRPSRSGAIPRPSGRQGVTDGSGFTVQGQRTRCLFSGRSLPSACPPGQPCCTDRFHSAPFKPGAFFPVRGICLPSRFMPRYGAQILPSGRLFKPFHGLTSGRPPSRYARSPCRQVAAFRSMKEVRNRLFRRAVGTSFRS